MQADNLGFRLPRRLDQPGAGSVPRGARLGGMGSDRLHTRQRQCQRGQSEINLFERQLHAARPVDGTIFVHVIVHLTLAHAGTA